MVGPARLAAAGPSRYKRSMRRTLQLHPDGRRDAVSRIEVEVTRSEPGRLVLHYALMGRIEAIAIPPTTEPVRSDGLWQHTCFEAFLRAPGAAEYREFNFAPSRLWAAYCFDGYRSGMRPADAAPTITVAKDEDRFILNAVIDLPTGAGELRLAVAAVVEDSDGTITYWALNHPPGKPDFHHDDGFALEIGP